MAGTAYIVYEDIPLEFFAGRDPKPDNLGLGDLIWFVSTGSLTPRGELTYREHIASRIRSRTPSATDEQIDQFIKEISDAFKEEEV